MNEATTNKLDESFEEKLARTEGVDKDFAEMLTENWQRVLGSCLAVILGVWVYGEYKAANESRVGEASKRFALVQSTIDKLQDPNENKEQVAKLIADNITALNTTYDGTSYEELAPLYQADSLRLQGKLDLAEQEFSKLSQVKSGKDFGRSDLVKELAGLALARTLIDEQKQDQAVKTLEMLVKDSKIVNLEALLILARITEEKSKVETLAKELKLARPEFSDQVDRELIKYGISLK